MSNESGHVCLGFCRISVCFMHFKCFWILKRLCCSRLWLLLKDYEYLTVREHRAKHEPENQTHRTDLLMSCGRRVHLRHITSVCYRNTADWPTHFQQGETPRCFSEADLWSAAVHSDRLPNKHSRCCDHRRAPSGVHIFSNMSQTWCSNKLKWAARWELIQVWRKFVLKMRSLRK